MGNSELKKIAEKKTAQIVKSEQVFLVILHVFWNYY